MNNYKHFSFSERVLVEQWLKERFSYRKIDERLGRGYGAVSHEVNLNKEPYKPSKENAELIQTGKMRMLKGRFVYNAKIADDKAKERGKNSHNPYLIDSNEELYKYIEGSLKKGNMPDVISGRIRIDFPCDENMRVSATAIYEYIYTNSNKNNWWEYLYKAKKKPRPHRKDKTKRGTIKERVSIHEREEEANKRERIGHLEGDSVIGKMGGDKKIIHTEVDRKTRKFFAVFATDKTAKNTKNAMEKIVNDVENSKSKGFTKKIIQSITLDNGSEFAKHMELKEKFQINTYFADAYSSWQRGTNENHNRMLRRFFSKKRDFSKATDSDLKEAVDFMNNLQRKILGYKTPNEVWDEEMDKLDYKLEA